MELNHSILSFVFANAVVLAASIVHASSGMGFAMIAAPLLALISLEFVPGPMLFINLFLSTLMLRDGISMIDKREITILLPSILIGTVIAATLLVGIPPRVFGILFSVLILLAVAISLLVKIPKLSRLALGIGGVIGGLMGTTSGISGPPLAVLYQRENINKTRATLALVFSFSYISSLVALTHNDLFSLRLAFDGLILLPGLITGYLLARHVRGKLTQFFVRTLMLSLASVSALILLVKYFVFT